jgi:hypothetical protein
MDTFGLVPDRPLTGSRPRALSPARTVAYTRRRPLDIVRRDLADWNTDLDRNDRRWFRRWSERQLRKFRDDHGFVHPLQRWLMQNGRLRRDMVAGHVVSAWERERKGMTSVPLFALQTAASNLRTGTDRIARIRDAGGIPVELGLLLSSLAAERRNLAAIEATGSPAAKMAARRRLRLLAAWVRGPNHRGVRRHEAEFFLAPARPADGGGAVRTGWP